jgi:uncharacterized protein YbjT (DUF2867 family)
VVRGLTRRGVRVRAIVRDVAAARGGLPESAEIVGADLADRASLDAALDGIEVLYVGLGRTANLVELEKAVVDAARGRGVRQYVKCSGVKVAGGQAVIQRIHAELEDYVRANVPYTIVAPSFFMQNFLGLAGAIAGGALPLPTGEARAGLIDVEDIGRSVVAVMGDDAHLGKRYALTGPESLSHGEVAAIFARALERPVQFIDVPEAAFIAGCVKAGMEESFASVLADVYVRFFGTGDADIVTDCVRDLTGTAPRSLEAWVRENAAAFRG